MMNEMSVSPEEPANGIKDSSKQKNQLIMCLVLLQREIKWSGCYICSLYQFK